MAVTIRNTMFVVAWIALAICYLQNMTVKVEVGTSPVHYHTGHMGHRIVDETRVRVQIVASSDDEPLVDWDWFHDFRRK